VYKRGALGGQKARAKRTAVITSETSAQSAIARGQIILGCAETSRGAVAVASSDFTFNGGSGEICSLMFAAELSESREPRSTLIRKSAAAPNRVKPGKGFLAPGMSSSRFSLDLANSLSTSKVHVDRFVSDPHRAAAQLKRRPIFAGEDLVVLEPQLGSQNSSFSDRLAKRRLILESCVQRTDWTGVAVIR